MKKINDFDKVQEVTSGAFPRIPDGAYIVGVKKVEDMPDKEFLRMELDICKGEYKNWFQQEFDGSSIGIACCLCCPDSCLPHSSAKFIG